MDLKKEQKKEKEQVFIKIFWGLQQQLPVVVSYMSSYYKNFVKFRKGSLPNGLPKLKWNSRA